MDYRPLVKGPISNIGFRNTILFLQIFNDFLRFSQVTHDTWYWHYSPHTPRDSVYLVCGIFFKFFGNGIKLNICVNKLKSPLPPPPLNKNLFCLRMKGGSMVVTYTDRGGQNVVFSLQSDEACSG